MPPMSFASFVEALEYLPVEFSYLPQGLWGSEQEVLWFQHAKTPHSNKKTGLCAIEAVAYDAGVTGPDGEALPITCNYDVCSRVLGLTKKTTSDIIDVADGGANVLHPNSHYTKRQKDMYRTMMAALARRSARLSRNARARARRHAAAVRAGTP